MERGEEAHWELGKIGAVVAKQINEMSHGYKHFMPSGGGRVDTMVRPGSFLSV